LFCRGAWPGGGGWGGGGGGGGGEGKELGYNLSGKLEKLKEI
jgi:hypothetical protein